MAESNRRNGSCPEPMERYERYLRQGCGLTDDELIGDSRVAEGAEELLNDLNMDSTIVRGECSDISIDSYSISPDYCGGSII